VQAINLVFIASAAIALAGPRFVVLTAQEPAASGGVRKLHALWSFLRVSFCWMNPSPVSIPSQ